MNDRIGQQIGNYRLSRLLGQGGFAEVYLGEHLYLKTQAALKFLHGRLTEQDVQHFMHEAQTLAALKHPHIVRISDFGLEQMTPYIVMDYAPYGTLRNRHPRGAIVPLPQVLTYVKQIGAALTYIHEHKLIHRDIKPENMLLDEQNQVQLSDFGIAVIAHRTASMQMQNITGTVCYMAPEQFRGYPTSASDQYSLGILIYEWLCGECPFQGANFIEMGMKHATAPVPSLRQKVPTLVPEVEQTVFIALEKDEKQRFSSVQDFVLALEQAMLSNKSTAAIIADTSYSQYSSTQLFTANISNTVFPQGQRNLNASFPITEPATSQPSTPSIARVAKTAITQQIGTALLTYTGHQHKSNIFEYTPSAMEKLYWSLGNKVEYTPSVVKKLYWSPDGTHIASLGYQKGKAHSFLTRCELHVWNVKTGQKNFTFTTNQHWSSEFNGIWSPDAKHLVTGNPSHWQQWSTKTWEKRWEADIEPYSYLHSYSPDGKYILGLNMVESSVNIILASTGKLFTQYHIPTNFFARFRGKKKAQIEAAAWSPDSCLIAFYYRETLYIWNAIQKKNLFAYPYKGFIDDIVWSADGKYLYLYHWNWYQKFEVATRTTSVYGSLDNMRCRKIIAWSPDKQYIASTGDTGISLWRVGKENQYIYTYEGHQGYITAAVWSPDGARIASSGVDGTVRLWQVLDQYQSIVVPQELNNASGNNGKKVKPTPKNPEVRKIKPTPKNPEIEQAEQLFSSGQERAAGSMAGVALEFHLKKLCERHQLSYDKAGMGTLIQMLQEAGVFPSETAKHLFHLASIRNKCAHASLVSKDEVRLLIREVKEFIR